MNGDRYVIEPRYVIMDLADNGNPVGHFEDYKEAIDYIGVLEEENSKEKCPTCGQDDNIGDCNHAR